MKKKIFSKTIGPILLCLIALRLQAQTGKPVSPVAVEMGSDSLHYLAFEFSEAKLFVLADRLGSHKHNYLLVMDETGKLQSSAKVPGNFREMYLTCDQKIYVGDKDSLSQVYVQNDSVFFGAPVFSGKILYSIRQCLLMADGVVFRQKEYPAGMRSLLYAFYKDENNKEVAALVFEVSDSLALEKYELMGQQRQSNASIYMPKQRPRYESRASKNFREEKATLAYKDAYYKLSAEQKTASGYHVPVDMLVNYHNEKFYVLDYTNGCIAVINRFLSERRVVDLADFTRETDLHDFMVDQVTGDFYCFEGIGHTKPVRRYGRDTGKLTYSKSLPDVHAATNLRIYNQRLYYLDKPDKNRPLSVLKMADLF